jgi:hypothetical protein
MQTQHDISTRAIIAADGQVVPATARKSLVTIVTHENAR